MSDDSQIVGLEGVYHRLVATLRPVLVAVLLSGLFGPSTLSLKDPRPSDAGLASAVERTLALREYEASQNDIGLQAPNRAHNLRTYFEPTGVSVHDRTAAGTTELLALRVSGLGRYEAMAKVQPGEVSSAGARAEIRRPGLTEWYVNSDSGLEQGFTLEQRPAGRGELVLELDVEHARGQLIGDRVLFEAASGRRLEYAKLVVEDADGRTLPARMELTEPGRLRLFADDSGATYPVVFDPLLSSTWDGIVYGGQTGARMGVSVAAAGDVNGDGYADAIVGAHLYDSGDPNEGIAVVFHGSPTGITLGTVADANSVIQSNQEGAELGHRVAGAGDVNGDGYSDVIIGAHFYQSDEAAEGAAFVFLGSSTGVVAAGDPSNAHAQLESNQAGANFGENVAGAGDVNGDGYADVIVSAPFYDSSQVWEGSAFIFLGSATGIADGNPSNAATELEGDQTGMQFGMGLAGAGDVNGDGYGDVIVGGPFYGSPEGAAFVFHGGPSGVPSAGSGSAQAERIESDQGAGLDLGAQLGWSVAGAGDVNGDGYADVIVGAHTYDNGLTDEGAAFVFHGSSDGIVPNTSTNRTPANANATLEGNQFSANFGSSVAAAGDVNGDGYADVIVGAPNYDNPTSDEGNAFVFVGGPSGVGNASPSTAFVALDNSYEPAQFGFSVAGAGDLNGDGYADVIVGAWLGDAISDADGYALIYHGGAKGVTSGNPLTAARVIDSNQIDANFGFGLASAGDVNGDGYGDLIVGAYNYDGGDPNEGAAFVFHGTSAGITATSISGAASVIAGENQDDSLGYSVASAGDVNGDGYGDVIIGAAGWQSGQPNEGGAFVYHGSGTGIVAVGTPADADAVIQANQDEAYLGFSVAPAGDVNGDGYGDVLVGAAFYNNPDVDEGAAFLYEGSPTGIVDNGTPLNADAMIEGNATGIEMGYSLDGVGDLNGDGYADVAVGAVYYTSPGGEASEGGVFVYYGSASGIEPSGNPGNADAVFESNQVIAAAGTSVSGAGDVNGDGYDDLITGASLYTSGQDFEGAAFVFYGGASGIGAANPSNADAIFQSNQDAAFFGGSVDAAGDVNGDGFADVIVGAEGYDGPSSDEGGAFVFLGKSTGLASGDPTTAAAVFDSNQITNPSFGLAAGIGDVNGDGFADVAVGGRNYDNELSNEGVVALFYGGGNRTGRPVLASQLRGGGSSTPVAAWGVSNSYQGFDVRLTATQPQGAGLVKLQVEACPASVPFGQVGCTTQTQAGWTAILPPSSSVTLTHTVAGLTAETLYHWRARVLHAQPNPGVDVPSPAHGPWRRLQAQAIGADLGTPPIPDTDGDGVLDPADNCVAIPNPSQLDTDLDSAGDACDSDDDGDYLLDVFETDTGSYVSPGNTGSDPLDADSDDDGFEDGFEVTGHANPNDPFSRPLFLGFDQLDGGTGYTCGVLTNGELSCFGNPPNPQPSGTFKQVAAGATSACALRTDDTIVCWGPGASGETSPPSTSYLQISGGGGAHFCGLLPGLTLECWGANGDPQAVPPGAGQFTEVAAGFSHSCALGLDGHATCWGNDGDGQSTAPTSEAFVELAIGWTHSCGLRSDSSIVCWGNDAQDQTSVPAGSYLHLAAGWDHTCALTTAGAISCWGSNVSGQTNAPSGTFIGVFAGPSTSCGIRENHSAECWGANISGEASPPILPFPDVALGFDHGCELTPARSIRCFGDDYAGQVSPPPMELISAVAAGDTHSCAIELDGDVICFGDNFYLQSESQSAAGNPFVQVDGGMFHTCGVRADGSVDCWGADVYGQSSPPEGSSFVQVSAGGTLLSESHSCGVTTFGAIACWGGNTSGQAVGQGGAWRQVSAGGLFSCGVRADLTLGCWGTNTFGQATPPSGFFTQVEAGDRHACARAVNGTVQCWGAEEFGETTPVPGSYERIAVAFDTTCGVLKDGSIACWGYDFVDPSPALDGVDDDDRAEGGDNCPVDANATQIDTDADGVGDVCDTCPSTPDPDRFDRDGDGVGDACDNCVDTYNPLQEDTVGPPNGIGDACEDTLVIVRPALLPPPPGPPPGAPSGFAASAPPPPPAGEALYDVFLYCPAFPIQKVQLGVIMPEDSTTATVNFGLGCTPDDCLNAVGQGLIGTADPVESFAKGPLQALATDGARRDTVYFSLQSNPGQVLCPSSGPVPEIEVRVAQFQISNPVTDMPTPSLTTEGLSAAPVNLLEPLKNSAGRVLEPAEYAFTAVNQDPTVSLTLAPAAGDTSGRKWQVELDTNLELHRVTFGLVASAGTLSSQMSFTGCTTASGPQLTRRDCQANPALGPYVNPSTSYPVNPAKSYTVGPGELTSGLRTDTLYVSLAGARPSSAALPALNVAGQPVLLGVVAFTTSTVPPTLTLQGVGTTSVFGAAYVDTSNAGVGTPLVQVGSSYNAASDYDADGRSDDLDNCAYTANPNQANNGGVLTSTADAFGDLCQCADGDALPDIGIVNTADTAALRSALTGVATPEVMSRCSVAGGPECDVLDYAIFRRAILGLPGPGIKSVCSSAVRN